MKCVIMLLVCLVVLSGCGGSGSAPQDSGIKVSGTFNTTGSAGGGWEILAYQQGHAGDPKYLVGKTGLQLGQPFEFTVPKAGVYNIDLRGIALDDSEPVVWHSWMDIEIPETGYDMGSVVLSIPPPKVSGTFDIIGPAGDGWRFLAYQQGHADDPKYLVGGTILTPGQPFEFTVPKAGVYDINLKVVRFGELLVCLRWEDVDIPETGFDMGAVVFDASGVTPPPP